MQWPLGAKLLAGWDLLSWKIGDQALQNPAGDMIPTPIGRSSDVGHARDPNELLEVLGDELRPVVGDDPGPCFRVQFLSPLQDDLDVRPRHRLPQIPVDDVTATAIENAAQVVERP